MLIVLILIGGFAYGQLIYIGGLFGDDPVVMYAYHRLGNSGFDEFYGWARPYSTWVYKIIAPIAGKDPQIWQAISIAVRVLSSWTLFVFLEKLFKGNNFVSLYAAVLSLIYPGFTQQAHALHFLLHFSTLSIALLSLYLMICAIETQDYKRKLVLISVSIITACVHVSTEYFFGLELLRPLIIYLTLGNLNRKKVYLRKVLSEWLPYISFLGPYLIWRVFLFQPIYPSIEIIELMKNNFSQTIIGVLKRLAIDIWKVSIAAWGNAINLSLNRSNDLIYGFFTILISTSFGLFFNRFIGSEKKKVMEKKRAIWLGIGGLILGGVPLWVSQTPLEIVFPWNRTTLCFLFGVSVFIAGCFVLLPTKFANVLFTTITGLSILFQFQTGLDYQRQWNKIQSLFTQFAVKAPYLLPDTLVLYDALPLRYYSANNLNAFLNWIYDTERGDGPERYKMFEISERLGNLIPALDKNIEVVHGSFQGNTNQVIVLAIDPRGCLVILDREEYIDFPLPHLIKEAQHLSNPNFLITAKGAAVELPMEIFSEINTAICE